MRSVEKKLLIQKINMTWWRLFLMLVLFVVGCVNSLVAETPPREEMTLFMQTPLALKLSPALQKKLRILKGNRPADERFNLIMGLSRSLGEAERKQLKEAEVLIRTIIGTVLTATAPARKIPTIAAFDFIERIELPTTIRLKGEPKGER